jgi:hypothetical protein
MNLAPPTLHPTRPIRYLPHDKGRLAGDLHLVGFRDGEPSGATFDRITGVLLRWDADATLMGDDLTMTVAGDAIAIHLTRNRDTVEAITVHEAPAGPAFRKLLFQMLSAGPYVLVRTAMGDVGCLIHAGTVAGHDVPADIIDGLGPMLRVADAEGLGEALSG